MAELGACSDMDWHKREQCNKSQMTPLALAKMDYPGDPEACQAVIELLEDAGATE